MPPAPIRQLRDYTRLREDLTRDRSRYWQRLEKLLEDAAIKVSAVASTLDTLSTRDMIEALIAGERDPRRLADLARGRMKAKRSDLITALDGRFDDHHAELARMLLGQIDALSAQIDALTARIEQLIDEMDEAGSPHRDRGASGGPSRRHRRHPDTGAHRGRPHHHRDRRRDPVDRHSAPLRPSVIERLDEIPGIGQRAAHTIIAEIGLDMTRFPTPEHLVSWAKLCPRTIRSGPISRGGKAGKGNPYLKGALGEAAAAAAKTNTFLGERDRRLVKRRGKLKALVAVARSILIRCCLPPGQRHRHGGRGLAVDRGRAARRDHRRRPARRADDHRRDWAGHDSLSHTRAPGVLGQTVPAHDSVRSRHPRRQDRQGQPLSEGSAR